MLAKLLVYIRNVIRRCFKIFFSEKTHFIWNYLRPHILVHLKKEYKTDILADLKCACRACVHCNVKSRNLPRMIDKTTHLVSDIYITESSAQLYP